MRKCQTAGKRVAKRAKVRGHSPQEAPRTSGKVSRSETFKKRRHMMKEIQKRSVIGEEKSLKCQEYRQGGRKLSQPWLFPAGTLGGLDIWLSLPQGRDGPANCSPQETGPRAGQAQVC